MSVSKVVSIEITDMVTRVSEMSYGKKNPVINKSIIFDNPEYSVDDGFIADRPAYGELLKDKLKEANIKCKDVVFVLTSNKVVSREITVPEMSNNLIADLIENERGDYFPMDTSDHIFTFSVLEKLKEEKQLRLMVYAAPEILIKNYQALAAERDLKIIAIDYNGNTLYQWLSSAKEPMDMFIQVNEKSSMFTILENGTLALQRNMNFGSSTLTNALAYTGYFGKEISNTDALLKLRAEEMLYHSYVEMEDAQPEDSAQQKLHVAKEYLTEAVRPFISNISRVLEYYNSKNREAKVVKLYIGGVGATIKGLKELIESEFNGIEIEIVDKLPIVAFNKKNLTGIEHATELIGCIGASAAAINFYRKNEKKELESTLIFCIVALVIVTIAGVFIVLNGKFEYDTVLKQQAKLQIKQTELQAMGIEVLESEFNAAQARIVDVLDMDSRTFNHNENWNTILAQLEELGVKGMTVTSLNSSPTDLTMNVLVESKEQAARFLLQMQKIDYFESVAINGLTETEDPDTGIITVSFSVMCTYKKPSTIIVGEEGTVQ